MEKIIGKTLIFTDLHLGLKNASKSSLTICVNVIKEIISFIKNNNVKNIIFLGDWNHSRTLTENNVLNVSYKLMKALSQVAKTYMILGNHDIYMKNSVDINSLIIFNDIKNVEIISNVKQYDINGKISLFVPWLGDTSSYENESIDMMFGHFDVSHKYIIKAYIEDNSKKYITKELENTVNNENLLKTASDINNTAGNYIGDFVDVVKQNGLIFSGHIHGRREFLAKKRNFILVGDPYQQNLGEIDNTCGFYILNEDSSYKFYEITSAPKHIQIYMSKINTFDFSSITGNIIHKIYDVEIDRVTDAKISQKITDYKPYEELLPDYAVQIASDSEITQNQSIELIKKSKLEYIKNYIDNIDKNILDDNNINSSKLFETLKEYYNKVSIDEK